MVNIDGELFWYSGQCTSGKQNSEVVAIRQATCTSNIESFTYFI